MPEVMGRVKTNVRDRINAIPVLITKPMDTLVAGVENLVALKPVKAVTYVAEHAGDGMVSFINTQADISRRWMP